MNLLRVGVLSGVVALCLTFLSTVPRMSGVVSAYESVPVSELSEIYVGACGQKATSKPKPRNF